MKLFNFFSSKSKDYSSIDVGSFYDQHYDAFHKVYGEVIQAFRTNDLSKILTYQIEQIGIEDGFTILDAGCGVCGPARFFAKHTSTHIHAVSISKVQCTVGEQKINEENLSDKITVHHHDYHKIDKLFKKDFFDRIYFLESFGHSNNKEMLIKACWKVLKPGGEIYIKDLFIRKVANAGTQNKINKEITKINNAYHYDVADLNLFLDLVRDIGYVISFVKTIDISLEDFENLAISNEWQELTGIATIASWDNYVFPIDFFEIKLYKPEYDTAKGMHRYFIQNLFQLKVNNLDKNEL
ncbi:MAG: class I SAM-dependent methyltransferase [Bacteroidetes bacterium]|nr:class I SAM-dependent methyltransferase [Bacteroidota bacterium]